MWLSAKASPIACHVVVGKEGFTDKIFDRN
jgi:hypothetical protein